MTRFQTKQIGDCTLILGDCREVMPTLGRVDAVVTDPPYGIKQDKGFGGFGGFGQPIARREYKGEWDSARPEADLIVSIAHFAPACIMWGGQYFADLLSAQGKWLWWDKCQTMPTYGDGELAWTNLSGNAPKKFVYNNNGLQAKEKDKEHPTQKPVQLMQWCLGFLPDAETILDPFCGSGSTGVACVNLGRKFVGVELDERYFEIACRRIEQAYKQPRLFPEPEPKQKMDRLL